MSKFALTLFLVTVLVGNTQDTVLVGDTQDTVLVGDTQDKDKTAPTFYAKTLDGEKFFLSEELKKQKPVVLSFFATWCAPCRKEIPVLNKIQNEHPGISFYLVDVSNLEQGGIKLTEDPDEVRKMIESMNVTMTVLMDKYGVAAESYGALELPKTVVIDQGGEIVYEKTGYESGDELAELIKILQELEHVDE